MLLTVIHVKQNYHKEKSNNMFYGLSCLQTSSLITLRFRHWAILDDSKTIMKEEMKGYNWLLNLEISCLE